MSVRIHHGPSDAVTDGIVSALEAYQADHPAARIDVYRQNSVSVRVRVIDPGFADVPRSVRHDDVWKYLDRLPEEPLADLSMLVLLAPAEIEESFANVEFENPLPSHL